MEAKTHSNQEGTGESDWKVTVCLQLRQSREDIHQQITELSQRNKSGD